MKARSMYRNWAAPREETVAHLKGEVSSAIQGRGVAQMLRVFVARNVALPLNGKADWSFFLVPVRNSVGRSETPIRLLFPVSSDAITPRVKARDNGTADKLVSSLDLNGAISNSGYYESTAP